MDAPEEHPAARKLRELAKRCQAKPLNRKDVAVLIHAANVLDTSQAEIRRHFRVYGGTLSELIDLQTQNLTLRELMQAALDATCESEGTP